MKKLSEIYKELGDASELELEQHQRIKELESALIKVRSLAEYGEGDHQAAPEYATKILSENVKNNRRSDDGTN